MISNQIMSLALVIVEILLWTLKEKQSSISKGPNQVSQGSRNCRNEIKIFNLIAANMTARLDFRMKTF